MSTDAADYKFKVVIILNFFDPCKSVLSVLSVVRFGFLYKAIHERSLRISFRV